jgi:hypothetical protein
VSASSYRSGDLRWPGRTLIQKGQADKAGTVLTAHAGNKTKVTGSTGQTGQADKAGTIVKGHAGIKTKVTGSMDRKVDGTIR